jgi:hypothetical protein
MPDGKGQDAAVAARYGWQSFPIGTLGGCITPVAAFRTDDWPLPEKGDQIDELGKAIEEAGKADK